MIISLDTETTGLDIVHGAKPFLVTWCEVGEPPCYIEWPVDPLTRQVLYDPDELACIAELLEAAELIYLHNAKFDARALTSIGISLPWTKVRDTLVASHLLASNRPHNLTWLCIEYLGKDIEPLEQNVKKVTQVCRAIVKRDFPSWRIAQEGLPDMPSVRNSSKRDEDKPWKNDMWLPRALFWELEQSDRQDVKNSRNQDWLDACSKYACGDSEHTLYLGLEMEKLIRERGFWNIYEHRLQLPRVDCEMEEYGVTARGDYTISTIAEYEQYVSESRAALVTIASEFGHDLDLAEGAALNDNMRDFFYGAVHQLCPQCKYEKRIKHWNGEGPKELNCPKCSKRKRQPSHVPLRTCRQENLNLPVITNAKTYTATLNKDTIQQYILTLQDGPALEFMRIMADERVYETELGYMHQYTRYWVPVKEAPGYYRIHSSINPCGTDHLRQSSNSPNMQNVSVQDESCEECDGKGCSACGGTGKSRLSVRSCFGPLPTREWWDLDFRNLEKRIPVYECMEPSLVEVFEKPDDPPYWGSDHNVLAALLFPDEYWPLAEVRDGFKKKYLAKYKRVKNTNFAKQYGAGKRKVDATAGVVGAYEKIERGLPKIAELQAYYLRTAEKVGLVYTIPDKTIDPDRGYPILASRTEDGRVLSTTPFNYHVSGTACWAKNTALIRCAEQCSKWRDEGFDAHVALEVHDSILFDFPRGGTPNENLPKALILRELMEQSGENLIPRIPTPVSVSYHIENWAKETPI